MIDSGVLKFHKVSAGVMAWFIVGALFTSIYWVIPVALFYPYWLRATHRLVEAKNQERQFWKSILHSQGPVKFG